MSSGVAEGYQLIEGDRLQQTAGKGALFSALAFVFFIPVSPALMNVSLALTLLFVLLRGDLKEFIKVGWRNPVAKAGVVLFAVYIFGITWSIVDVSESLRGLKKYNELWYIALLMPIFMSAEQKRLGVNVFLVSMLMILFLVYMIYFRLLDEYSIPVSEQHMQMITVDGGFRTHIITNILMAFAQFILAQRVLFSIGSVRWGYFVLFSFSYYYTMFISTGTTGQILAIGLIFLLLMQHFRWKSVWMIPLFVTLTVGYGYLNGETSISHAFHKVDQGLEDYSDGVGGGSLNQRLEFIENSIYLIKERPFLGSGTGSFEARYAEIPQDRVRTNLTSNAHNEYVVTGIQLGLLGVFGLLALFSTQVIYSFSLKDRESMFLAQGVGVLILVSCLGNSMIMDSGEGHFWAFFSALLFHDSVSSLDSVENSA